ncbi:unknown substrate putative PTS system IIC component [Mesoplasma florum L1]|uniref:Ascorbate-specific PTS system EIIC component n=1 Tax=Mesoplasma florum (strain ATCC 33453 / NBRC 100688 / NCTC 11704 / L1) TaxID=265311 RepID=Q6F0H4_MESFL|nr:PTS ascorbate transporter subunit IIC [Mesoplasma florum]AAT75999.1 unknown substrate putative PTS system IIC component [Mesoplasma florum L1]ATI74288.1 PTS ascorbate transporter subunit IIC [Mesoplasma florum]
MNEFIFFIKGFFGAPAVLIGLFALFGSLLQRKKFTEVLVSTLKAAVGYLILSGGIGLLVSTLDDFTTAFNELFGLQGVMPNSDALAGAIMEAIPEIATIAALMMFISIVLNIIFAKFSRFKYIFLTGHHTLFICVAVSTIFHFSGMSLSTDVWYFLIVGSAIVSLYMLLSPALTKKYMNHLTGDDKLYIGHANVMGFAIAGGIGGLVGKLKKGNVKSTEEIKFPKWLSVFSNSTVSVAVMMLMLFGVTYASLWGVAGKEQMVALGIIGENDSILVKIILDALIFTAGVEILIFGITTMINELIPALEGISKKLIPGAKMAVDCSVALSYSPTAVLIGFVSSFTGGIIGLLISIGLNLAAPAAIPAVIIPGIIAHFFTGGVSGTFGNIKGGILGAILGAFVNGIILTIVPLMFILMQSQLGWIFDSNGVLQWAESDYLIFNILGWILNAEWTKWLIMAIVFVGIGGLLVDGHFWIKKDKIKRPELYVKQKTTKKSTIKEEKSN